MRGVKGKGHMGMRNHGTRIAIRVDADNEKMIA